ncbi:MAG: HNH endonuclease signature motif containing protein [Gemmatimonadales bacterium]|nr:HNH endonuclease signature motif containing protein [Gemmatimonadales bacterium]
MPNRSPHPCAQPRCPNTITSGGRCDVHRRREPDTRTDTRTITARGYGADWRRVRAVVILEEPTCRLCRAMTPRRVTRTTDVDHIVPKAQGGTDERSNLQGLCHSHHSAKTVREDGGFGRRTG